ncbi:GNAT family N-acetyltransferase [Oleiagrimonas soli]|uniref:GCN5 family acetyltransferase n=1 Tax=Oleiagrimonas soli TaxID=1543381 RepID=A0A099CUP8_9GAMM|nr:GNAT family N-acetyltransferase [Oleiagrimonas soli]KGI77658.1 GCN5 family acetyltransferase [Oleiagrimonas soli]MBB6182826.1 ribosomal protein S18 acetylase RimI-like enzyme [Oleiagrimonas soli]
MHDEALDNPFWSSLTSWHRALAVGEGEGDVRRYPAAYAPFLGVAHADADAAKIESALDALVEPDSTWLLLGVAPRLSAAWSFETFRPLAQMVCDAPLPTLDGPEIIELDARHRADVLELVARVYPHYFRERTTELGRYFGIYRDGRLAAMAGERLGAERAREISAVCTDPAYTGRGYARQLIAFLVNDHLQRGWTPYLHVSQDNERARDLYLRMGFRQRREIGFWALRRAS